MTWKSKETVKAVLAGLVLVLALAGCDEPGEDRTPNRGDTRTHHEGYTEVFVDNGPDNRFWRPANRAERTRGNTIQWYDVVAGGWFDTCVATDGTRNYCVPLQDDRTHMMDTRRRVPSTGVLPSEESGH